MSTHTDAMAMMQASLAALTSPQPGDAAGLLANAIRLMQHDDGPAPSPQSVALAHLTDLCRTAIDAEQAFDLARLTRDTARRALVAYVDQLERTPAP